MLTVPRQVCSDLDDALEREWLVTNGLGGYASSTISGANTRRYHGLLVAALEPPSARTVLLSKIDEEVEIDGSTYHLGTNEYESGTVHPDGFLFLDRVELDGMIPTFFYRAGGFALAKTIWMEYGKNTTYVRYTLSPQSAPIRLTLLPLCTWRDVHRESRGSIDWHWQVRQSETSIEIVALPDSTRLHVVSAPLAEFVSLELWYWRFKHRIEEERGLDSTEDLYLPGLFRRSMRPGDSFAVIATCESIESVDLNVDQALERSRNRQTSLSANATDELEKQLTLAADQFVVSRQNGKHQSRTIIAGYQWSGDWGRDAMISLEGLTLCTGRNKDAKEVLRTFAGYVDRGMLPNRFPEIVAGQALQVEYNTVDATLWFFHSVDRYLSATNDRALLEELFPILSSIIDWHLKGTRFGIRVDPSDGLVRAGETGVQLTWMDAKGDDWAVMPRIGKPVEISALWYRALRLMAKWSEICHQSSTRYEDLADQVRFSFERYWFPEGGYLYDVIDGPNGNDPSLRPNQLIALSLNEDLVPREHAKSILHAVQRELLTPVGLRTLSPRDPKYRPFCRGSQQDRDAAYHQGLVWEWLIGPYVDAIINVFHDRYTARDVVAGFASQLMQAGLGTLSEVHEAQPPYRPVGCIAQAWSVAEVLRALVKTRQP